MPADVENYGDAARRVMARGHFVVKKLGTDLRVLEHYKHWLTRRDLPSILQHMGTTMTPSSMKAMMDAIWRNPSDAELRAVARLLREDMGIRFRQEDPYPWAVPALITVFQVAAHNDAAPDNPEDQLSVEVKLEGLSGIPPGRFPRHEGKDIQQNVEWCYQALIKHPPDSIRGLAEIYAERENRVTDARSVVQNGIDRAIHWLDLAISR